MYSRYLNPLGGYSVYTFVCDTEADLVIIPTETAAAGSVAVIVENSDVYKLNHEKQWIKQATSSGGGGGGDEPDPDKQYVWDGGVEK